MNTELDRNTVTEHGIAAFKLVPNSRHYAADERAHAALGALCAAFVEPNRAAGRNFSRHEFAEVLESLTQFMPSLVQQRPSPEPKAPTPWRDEVTGQTARNPYEKPQDFESIRILERRDPLLAAHLKAIAGGVSYAYLAKIEDEKAERETLRKLPYGETEHKQNVFLSGTLTEQGQFTKLIHPAVVQFYRREAEPLEIPLNNLTLRGQLFKKDGRLHELVKRASEILTAWQKEDRARLAEMRAETDRKLAEMERSNT